MLRLPDGMRDRIAVEAEKNRRSMNAEIVARLEESLSSPIQLEPGSKRLDELIFEMVTDIMKREGAPVTIEIRPKVKRKKNPPK